MQSFLYATLATATLAAKGSFNYLQNGADWPGLCQTGTEQSPINITWVTHFRGDITQTGYQNFPEGEMTDLGTTLQFNTLAENTEATMTLLRGDGSVSDWKPVQFHFHAPSEHAIGGNLMELELHMVHLAAEGNDGFAAVLGVMFDRWWGGDECNEFLDSLEFNQDTETWDVTDVNVKDFLEGLNQDIFVSYDGSLTTPPCTEGVKWSLLMKVQNICTRQLKAFTARYADDPNFADGNGNNRITLPYNDRTIYYSGFI